MFEAGGAAPSDQSLGGSARASILWGGGSTLLRDVAQFGVMLILVRLLSPSDYGNTALAQSIIGLVSVISFATFSLHTLQIRDPADIDWQAHFTAAAALNGCIFCLTLATAWGLSFTTLYHDAALPLAGLAVSFLIEIPGTLRHRMLETMHDWKRFRILLLIGTALGLGAGLTVALLGGGIWALIIQVPMLGLPAAVDLFVAGHFRPQWTWNWAGYRETAHFTFNLIGSNFVVRGRQTTENAVLTTAYDAAALGFFTRAFGLATLIGARVPSVAMMSLYPIITRAEQRSERFQRMAGLVLRGVCWTTVPAATFLALCAPDAVALLYGPKWDAVSVLLPLAAGGAACRGITSVLSQLLLANNEAKVCLALDFVAAIIGIPLAIWLVPIGIQLYLSAFLGQGMLILGIAVAVLLSTRGISRGGVASAMLPAGVAVAIAAALIGLARLLPIIPTSIFIRLAAEGLLFGVAYIFVLRVAFSTPLAELLQVTNLGGSVARGLMLPIKQN